MNTPSLQNKVFTENPLLDEIVYNLRQLVYGTILKDQARADKYETNESIQMSDIYIATKSGFAIFEYFYYDEDILRTVPYYTEQQIHEYALDNSKIPDADRPYLLSVASKRFLENYVEYNNYYRMLNGEPSYDPYRVWQGVWINVDSIEPNSICTDLAIVEPVGGNWQPIHKLSLSYINELQNNGTIDYILTNDILKSSWEITDEDIEYLKHIGDKAVDYVTSRRAERFALLYCPSCDAQSVQKKYVDTIEANRLYMINTIYSEAYKYASDYYDNFCMVMVIVETVIDMIIELPEYLIRRDIFDTRTCKYIFEANGIKYFKDIPLKYQVSLVKNLNKLLRLKSTDKCIVDIASLFGSENISIFKYYILKDRNIGSDGRYLNKLKPDGSEDTDYNYDLKFIRVPILQDYDDYIRSGSSIYKYNDLIDEYWYGEDDPEEVKSKIKAQDFTVLKSKYYSVRALVDLTKRTFTMCYFTNLLMYNKLDASALKINVPYISSIKKFELVDIFCTLFSMSYLYYDAEDTIFTGRPQILNILGFNMEADMAAISQYVYSHYKKTLKDLKVDGFMIPDDGKLTFANLEEIFLNNKNIYNTVLNVLKSRPDKDTYDAYMYIYKSLFIMRFYYDYYKLPDQSIAETYRQFLSYKDSVLYNFLQDIASITSLDTRQETIANAMESIISSIDGYINSNEIDLADVFSGLPAVSIDFIKKYIAEVINYFKSFKIYAHNSSLIYIIDDKFNNMVNVIDKIMYTNYTLGPGDAAYIEEYIHSLNSSMEESDTAAISDKIWMYLSVLVTKVFAEYLSKDRYEGLCETIREEINRRSTFKLDDYRTYTDPVTGQEVKIPRVIDEIINIILSYINSEYVRVSEYKPGTSTNPDIVYHNTYASNEYVSYTTIDELSKMISKLKKDDTIYNPDGLADEIEKVVHMHANLSGIEYANPEEKLNQVTKFTALDTYGASIIEDIELIQTNYR